MEEKRTLFAGHWHVHALWLIALLVFTNTWNLLKLTDGESVRDFLSFAASIASMILAIVAIFYAFVSNRDSLINLGKIGQSSERASEASFAVRETTDRLGDLIDELNSKFGAIEPAVSTVAEQMEQIHALMDPKPTKKITSGGEIDLGQKVSGGSVVSLYLLLKAFQTQKFIDVQKVFSESDVWVTFAGGFFGAVQFFKPCNIRIDSDDSQFFVRSLGELDPSEITALINSKKKTDKRQNVLDRFDEIDAYFAEDEVDLAEELDSESVSGDD